MENRLKSMTLTQRAKRIAEIDEQITVLFDELHSLYRDGISTDEHNKLWDMVMKDGKSHWS